MGEEKKDKAKLSKLCKGNKSSWFSWVENIFSFSRQPFTYIYILCIDKKTFFLQDEEAKIVAGCCRGERAAQQHLYETYRGALYRMCLCYAHDEQEAEDFLHDGFIKVFQHIAQYEGRGNLGAWVRRVVLNTLLQQLRKRPKIIGSERLAEIAVDDVPDFDELLQPISSRQIVALLQELPKGYSLVFNLYYLEDKSHQEIAALLSISVGSSKSQLFKAKRALRQKIQEQYPKAYGAAAFTLLAYWAIYFLSASNI